MTLFVGEITRPVEESVSLIQKCLEGDQAAHAALYRLHAGDVYRLVYGMLGNREDAEEVVQDTFVYALRRLSRYEPGRASFRTWLFVIATSRARNKRRRRWLPTISLGQLNRVDSEPVSPDGSERPPEDRCEEASVQEEIMAALNTLSPKLREAAVLRHFEGLKYCEIGQILGIPRKTAESRVRLAHQALRKIMGELE